MYLPKKKFYLLVYMFPINTSSEKFDFINITVRIIKTTIIKTQKRQLKLLIK